MISSKELWTLCAYPHYSDHLIRDICSLGPERVAIDLKEVNIEVVRHYEVQAHHLKACR